MSINLDTEVVATRYDPLRQVSLYTVRKDGKEWTVTIPQADFFKIGMGAAHKQKRREHLAKALDLATRGPTDAEKAAKPQDNGPVQDYPLPERAKVGWSPRWYAEAKEIAKANGYGLAENSLGYLVFETPMGHVPISFEGIDAKAKGANTEAVKRIKAAHDELVKAGVKA